MEPYNYLLKSQSYPNTDAILTTPSMDRGCHNSDLTELFNSTLAEFTNNLPPNSLFSEDSIDSSKKRTESPCINIKMPNAKRKKLAPSEALERSVAEESFSLFEGDLGKELLDYCSSSTPPLDQSSSSIITPPATVSLLPESGLPEVAKLVAKPNSSASKQHQPQDSRHGPNPINPRSHLPLRVDKSSSSTLKQHQPQDSLHGPNPINPRSHLPFKPSDTSKLQTSSPSVPPLGLRVKVYQVDEPFPTTQPSVPGPLAIVPEQPINYSRYLWNKKEDDLLLEMVKEQFDFKTIAEAVTKISNIYRSSGACRGRLNLLLKNKNIKQQYYSFIQQ